MTWFKVDDQMATHAKILAAGNEAVGAWVRAGSWCAGHLTDGVLPASAAEMIAKKKVWDRLVSVGLMERNPSGELVIHDYLAYNPSSGSVQNERARRAKNTANHRERNRNVTGVVTGYTPVASEECNHGPSRPVPARPDPTQENKTTVPQPPALAPTDAAHTDPPPAALEFSAEHEEAPHALQSADVDPGSASSRRTGQSKGTRLEASWKPSELFYGWASKELGLSGVEVDGQLAEFHDYWAGVPGQRGRKLDWEATFRNRLREVGRRRRPAARNVGGPQSALEALDAIIAGGGR